jgi:hypothetical protein
MPAALRLARSRRTSWILNLSSIVFKRFCRFRLAVSICRWVVVLSCCYLLDHGSVRARCVAARAFKKKELLHRSPSSYSSSLSCSDLLHEFARNVEQSTNTTGATSATSTSTSLALHVELERHLCSLSNSVLLRGFRVLYTISKYPISPSLQHKILTVFP